MIDDVEIDMASTSLRDWLHSPDRDPKAVVVLHDATGVPERFNGAFATWLSEPRGVACLT